MLARVMQLFVVAGIVLAGCQVSDAPTSRSAAPSAMPSEAGPVRISGLPRLRQTALVVTDSCRTFTYETDRQDAARTAINQALGGYAAALPGGLQVTVESLTVRMRCHTAGAGAFGSYCAAEARLNMAATAKDRSGQEIAVTASKEATEQTAVFLPFVCAEGMPAVTKAVDGALAGALADIQTNLTARSGIPAR